MKVAFVNSGARHNYSNIKLRCMFCEALLMHKIESIGYAASSLSKPFVLQHVDERTYTNIVSCYIPLLSTLARRMDKSFLRKMIVALEHLAFTSRVIRRLPKDKVDVYIILHLWDYEIPFLNLILRTFRPTIIMWFGGSLRWYEQSSKWKYHFFSSIFRISLRRADRILVGLDQEQKHYLFGTLKLPTDKVTDFKEFIVDDKLFRRLDKHESAKKVGFSTDKINIVMISRIESTERINLCKDYEKDPFTALEIFRRLTQENPQVKLHVFGRGQGTTEFRRRIKQYGLRDKVKLYGYVERERLPEYYAAADLSFFPFPFITVNDGQANHESLLCGTPVVFFKRYPWVKTEHQGGFAIDRDPEQGAQQLLERLNSEYLRRKQEEATAIPHDFNIESFGNNLAKLLKQIRPSS
jgi:glycosyltransferase involved in cell wall biosynthesis